LILILVTVVPASSQGPGLQVPDDALALTKGEAQVYMVQMTGDPVVAYEGGIRGLRATKPDKGIKINPNSAKVKKYAAYLDGLHDLALSAVGGAEKVYDYHYTFNGFSALLTPAQAAALEQRTDVTAVWVDELRYPTTENSPDFLGLTADGGLWDMGYAGEDVIVGVIDTGIWPEHPSFSDQIDLVDRPGESGKRTRAYGPPPADWYGSCQSGELWSQDDCNYKLIGARYFKDGFTNHEINFSGDYLSARDADGHGSHTSSTAAGNAGPYASILGSDIGTISGMAPRARIAMYKACWADEGCAVSDLVASIDQAVADGVDVINYSIGGGSRLLNTSDSIAFLFAADAGVFVATSAGNSGPGPESLGNPGIVPWVTAVGASTQDRTFTSDVTLGNGDMYVGLGIGVTEELPLVDAADAGDELCNIGALDPSVVAGNIVLCRRGDIPLVDKSQAVLIAGGAGMILYNMNASQTPYLTTHAVPTAHIIYADGLAIKDYIASMGTDATAMIDGGHAEPSPAPWMASFSSRGPNGGAMDIIKPDVTAPGFGILAAYSPTPFLGAPGELYSVIQGTSMSSPHVAGLAALLVEAHPDWTPEMVKSALMTTAYQDVMKEDGSTPADPFDIGAGHVNPNPAVDPGLVYDAGFLDYLGFLCGNSTAVSQATCDVLASLGIPFDASDLNLPSIGIAELAGTQTVVRTVTNVGPAGTYHVSVEEPAGIDVVVDPDQLTLAEGESASYEVTFTNMSAPVGEWVFGSLTWTHGPHSVRSPIAIKPVQLSAPGEITGTGIEGSIDYDVVFGYTGDFAAGALGLTPPTLTEGNVEDDPGNSFVPFGPGTTLHFITVPAGAAYARFALFDEYTDGNDDLDLYVYYPTGYFAGSSGSPTSAEQVDVPLPMEGDYYVFVHGWQTDGPDANYTLFSWAPDLDEGNMTVTAPATAVLGGTGTITVDWSGLDPSTKYLGAVSYADAMGMFGVTAVTINTE